MGKENINGQMVIIMKETLKTIKCMAKDTLNGPMVSTIRADIRMTKDMEWGN